jgi:hypothetical protein
LKLHLRENLIIGEGSGPREISRCVVERVVTGVSKDRSIFIVRVGRLLDPEEEGTAILPKHWELLIRSHAVTSQKTTI